MERSWPVINLILGIAEKYKDAEIVKEKYLSDTFNRKPGEDPVFESVLSYNIKLLREEGFISANTLHDSAIGRITWKGHDLLDVIRGVNIREAANK